jgi:hypothetical protein
VNDGASGVDIRARFRYSGTTNEEDTMNRIFANDIKPGMLVHDENGPQTFYVTAVSASEVSTMMEVTEIVPSIPGSLYPGMVSTRRLFFNDEQGLWNLND